MNPLASALSVLELGSAIVYNPLIVSPESTVMDAIAQMNGIQDFGARTGDSSEGSQGKAEGMLNTLLQEARSSCMFVVEADRLIGLIVERDVVQLSAEHRSWTHLTVGQVMRKPLITVRESALTDGLTVLNLLLQQQIQHLPVLDDQDIPIGLITCNCLLQVLYSQSLSDESRQEVQQVEYIQPQTNLLAVASNKAECDRTAAQLETQNILLAKIARDEPLPDTLNALIEFIEQQLQGALCEVLLLDDENCLHLGAAPHLPQDYTDAMSDGLQIGEGVGTCGTAAFRRETVIVADIVTDPFWQDFKALALHCGLKACWASPILVSDGSVLGTLAVYYKEVRSPVSDELGLIERVSHIAGIAIARERSKLALSKNEERYSLATRAARVGVWEWNIKTNEFYLDPNIKALLGYTNAEIPNDLGYWITFVHPDDREAVMAAAQAYLDGKTPEYLFEHRMLHKDGSIVWILVRGEVLCDEQGNPERMLGTDTDITARKLAEQQLQELNQLLEVKVAERTAALQEKQHFIEKIADSSTAILYIYDLLEQRNIYTNSQIQTILGYAPEEIQAMGSNVFPNLVHPDDFPRLMERIAQCLEIGDAEVVDVEYRMRHANGDWCWLQSRDRLFKRTAEGLPWQIIGTAVDISDRKQAEEALRQKEAQYRTIFETVNDGIFINDLETGQLLAVNPAACQMHGYTYEEMLQIPPTDFIHVDSLPLFNVYIQTLKAGSSFSTEAVDMRKDGQIFDIEVTGTPFFFDGKLCGLGLVRDTSERKAAEARMKQQEQLLRSMYEGVEHSICIVDVSMQNGTDRGEFRFVSWNDSTEKKTGIPSATIVGKTPEELLGEAQGAIVRQNYQRCLEVGSSITYEEMLTFQGRDIWWLTTLNPLKDAAGQIYRIVVTTFEISDRKAAENALTKSEMRFRELAENVPGMRYVYMQFPNGSHGFPYISAYCRDLWEIDPAEVEQNANLLFACIDPEDATSRQEATDACAKTLQPLQWEGQIRTPSGVCKWIKDISKPTQRSDGAIVWDGIILDITTQKNTETALRQSEERHRLLAEISPVGIFRHDTEGRCTYVNERTLQLVGYPLEECLQYNWMNTIHPDDRQAVRKQWQTFLKEAAINPSAIYRIESRQLRTDGSMIWVLEQVVAERDAAGNITGYMGTLTDITDRKQAERQLQQLNQELETKVQERTAKLQDREHELLRATRLKDEFLATMSHELRTPLNAILGMTEGLQEQVFGEIKQEQLKALQTIEYSSTHLLELINDILNLAKVESGQIELNYTLTAVTSLCRSSLTFIKQQALKKRIQLEIKLPPNLPDIFIDERHIRQVLINLLSNAVKFTPEGGHITLEASHRQQPPASSSSGEDSNGIEVAFKDFLHIAITDTGIGIASEDITKLFQPFVQIDSALNRKYEGTGLGLALVKRIIGLHGGQVEVTSEVGVGSRFTITLPYGMATTIDSIPPPSSSGSSHHPHPFSQQSPPLILLAEDNEANIKTLSSYLRAKGYLLVVAKTGSEAIELAQAEHPDLILMDVQMPEMDGLEVMKAIRKDPTLANIPIIALTGLAMIGDRERCLAAGANDYLSKPVKLKQLTTLIQNFFTFEENQS